MERSNQLSLIPVLILILLCLIPVHASVAAGYSYYVDSFKVEGTVSQQDNFDDGIISPWIVDNGTAEESGGTAILKNPGDLYIEGSTVEESSEIETPQNSIFKIPVGSGNATATSRWITNVTPLTSQVYMMNAGFDFYNADHSIDGDIDFYVGIVNADQTTADYISSFAGIPIPTGLFAVFGVDYDITGNDKTETLEFHVAPITDPMFLNADFSLLSLLYDDDDLTRGVSASIVYGDDENVQTWEPFNKIAMPEHVGDLVFDEWSLRVASINAVPIPAALPLLSSALGLFGFIGCRRRKSN